MPSRNIFGSPIKWVSHVQDACCVENPGEDKEIQPRFFGRAVQSGLVKEKHNLRREIEQLASTNTAPFLLHLQT
jgi:hypothetical protein